MKRWVFRYVLKTVSGGTDITFCTTSQWPCDALPKAIRNKNSYNGFKHKIRHPISSRFRNLNLFFFQFISYSLAHVSVFYHCFTHVICPLVNWSAYLKGNQYIQSTSTPNWPISKKFIENSVQLHNARQKALPAKPINNITKHNIYTCVSSSHLLVLVHIFVFLCSVTNE